MRLEDRGDADDRAVGDDVTAVVRAILGRGRALASTSADALGAGVDSAMGALVGRRVERALRPGAPTVTAHDVVDALDSGSGSGMSPWIGAGVARLARTGRAARALGGRTPVGLAVRFGPAVYGAVTSNVRALDAAIGHLVTRARQQGVDVNAERVGRVAVQALAGQPIDPDADADHGALVRRWLQDAGRQTVPFGDRVSGLRRRRTPEAVAAALAAVDVTRLAR